ncbi:DHH family phosphoesterase [Desulfosarcina ovata]|uniref:Phosphoesterase n=2 Tax=Desulfosarcina ovata TaxID=83564 RepID=A0A5K8AGZ6_9BACT|nr:bifunctional oligoribonuclease/PAP phosphatase NrnA [Desulfosarcina ovata]BBO85149.1 phosphoesterase [Desulfosarcina ovata subsp. sediminis]BBO91901.1 phosphoesterase [Desulfosarcina ovata subsp. ovata]
MKKIIQQLTSSERILLASHTNPDGDAIGALLAMGLALEKLDRQVTLHNESSIPAVYRFLPSVHRIQKQLPDPARFDTAVILDCGSLNRVGSNADAIKTIPVIVNIDHHTTNSRFGQYHLVDVDACATSEIIYRLIQTMGLEIDASIATAIYTGILTDTGSFRFSNTNQAAFTICEAMVAAGVKPSAVAQHVYGTYSLGRIKLLNLALDSIEISNNGYLSIMTVTQEMLADTGTQPEDADGLINYARRIRDVKVAALIHELENGPGAKGGPKQFHVSLRSDGSVDVSRIATTFGGGGHAGAAGFSMASSLAELKQTIYNLSDGFGESCQIN